MSRSKCAAALALVLASGALAACGSPASSAASDGVTKDKIVVGVSSDVTGPAAANIMPYLNGIKAYVKSVNDDGGINGRTIELAVEDDRTETPKGVAIYRKFLTQEPALAMLGPSSTTIQNAIAGQVAKEDLPIVGPLVTSADIVSPFNPHFYSLACTYADQADVAVPFMLKKNGADKPRVMIALTETASGKEWAALIKDRVEKAGGSVASEHVLEFGALDEDVFAQQVAKEKPDILFLHGAASTAQVMMKSFAKFDVTDLSIGASGVMQDPVIPAAGPNVVSNYYAFDCYPRPSDAGAAGEKVAEAAKAAGFSAKEYDRSPFTQGYVAASVLAKAIDEAGDDVDRASVNEKLSQLSGFDTDGLSPVINFGKDNRLGVSGVLAFGWDKSSGSFTVENDFDDYAACVTKYYITKSIDEWSPDCVG